MIGAHRTNVFTDDAGFTCIVYHEVQVVKFNDTEIVLDTGGWGTATTVKRMNQVAETFKLGYRVFRNKLTVFVEFNGETVEFKGPVKLLRNLT